MANRVVNGNTHSENGWPLVDRGSCTWAEIPGCNPPVQLEIQNGWPLFVMRAYAADHNAFVEQVLNADSACWTETNDILGTPGRNNGSNHLGATAMDLRWKIHRFHVSYDGYSPAQIATVRELLDFYEGIIWWGQDWGLQNIGPYDCMHFQMNKDTFNNPRVGDFIARKIRADGFSTFRRGNTPAPPPVLSRADRYALTIIAEGQKLGVTPRGNKIAISVGLVESTLQNYANSNDPASMLLPHDNVGSDHMSTGVFQQQPNWGPLECRMDVACAARLFFNCDNGPGTRGLLKIRDGAGRIYDYNDESHTPGFFAQKVQGSAFPDRYDKRYAEAEQIYNRLLLLPPSEEGFLMALSDAEQHEVLNGIRAWMAAQKSRSPLHDPGEGTVGDAVDQVWDIDANVHLLAMFLVAFLGVPSQIELLERVAANGDTQEERMIAQAILAETADMHDVKEGILAALGRITTTVTPVSTAVVRQEPSDVEVFPAVRLNPASAASVSQMGPFASASASNASQEVLDALDRLKAFDVPYRDKFDQLTKGDSNDNA